MNATKLLNVWDAVPKDSYFGSQGTKVSGESVLAAAITGQNHNLFIPFSRFLNCSDRLSIIPLAQDCPFVIRRIFVIFLSICYCQVQSKLL